MTYLEIIEWISQRNAEIFYGYADGAIVFMYYCPRVGQYIKTYGTDLVSIVLEINNKELVK